MSFYSVTSPRVMKSPIDYKSKSKSKILVETSKLSGGWLEINSPTTQND